MTHEVRPITLNVRYNEHGHADIAQLMVDLELALPGQVKVTDWVDPYYVTATYTNASLEQVKEIIASIDDEDLSDSVNTDLKLSAITNAAGRLDIEIPETDDEPDWAGPNL